MTNILETPEMMNVIIPTIVLAGALIGVLYTTTLNEPTPAIILGGVIWGATEGMLLIALYSLLNLASSINRNRNK